MSNRIQANKWSLIIVWFFLISSGLYAMADYGSRVGRQGLPPQNWPLSLEQHFTVDPNRPTLVVFAHPLCPCTRATLGELELISRKLHGMVDIHILFYQPEDNSAMSDVWEATDLQRIAERIPGAHMHSDVEGRLAEHFGAYTSGQVLLYGSDNVLRFSGGITPSRGHRGANPGRAAVLSAVVSDEGVDPLAPRANVVFGCSLHKEDRDDRKLDAGELLNIGRISKLRI